MNENKQQVNNDAIEKTVTHVIKNKTFIVESVFPEDGKETLGTVLMRLMQLDCVSPFSLNINQDDKGGEKRYN